MTDPDAADTDPGSDFESRVLAFEQAWREGRPPSIMDYLPADETSPGGQSAERLRLLCELVCIDLERRWRQAAENAASPRPPVLEDYARQFPELGSPDSLPPELIGEEYRVRRRWGDAPSHEDFLAGPGRRRDAIASVLRETDRELEAEADEADEAGEPSRPVAPESAAVLHDRAPDPRAPLADSDYLLQRLIGAGRMGKVYRAWQRSLDRPVAVKFLRKAFLDDHDAVERFITEARTVARLTHPGIIGIHGLGRTPGGGYFLVMDWADGPDLARIIQIGGPVPIGDAVRWMIEACEAIEEAHWHGIVHCDLKPGNILTGRGGRGGRGGRVRVTDFGLARSLTDPTRTDEGIEGTAPFMAPEQVSRHWGPISEQTDVYGLGAVLYTLLTGQPPWSGRTLPDVLTRVVSAAPVTPPDALRPDLPATLREVCRRCLSKAPQQRFPAVAELRQALRGCRMPGADGA